MVSRISNMGGIPVGRMIILACLSSNHVYTQAFISTNLHRYDLSSRYHETFKPWRIKTSSTDSSSLVSASTSFDEAEAMSTRIDSIPSNPTQEKESSSPSTSSLMTLYQKIMETAGMVDESRYTFPATSSGEVSRLFR